MFFRMPVAQPQRTPATNISHPGRREFYSGLAVLTVLGAVAIMRGGPEESAAAPKPMVEHFERSSTPGPAQRHKGDHLGGSGLSPATQPAATGKRPRR